MNIVHSGLGWCLIIIVILFSIVFAIFLENMDILKVLSLLIYTIDEYCSSSTITPTLKWLKKITLKWLFPNSLNLLLSPSLFPPSRSLLSLRKIWGWFDLFFPHNLQWSFIINSLSNVIYTMKCLTCIDFDFQMKISLSFTESSFLNSLT